MKRVFVSYSSHDRPTVAAVVNHLTAAGFDVWFDQNVSGGQQWWDVILEQLRSCDVVVAMVTESSVASAACRSELTYGRALGKTIVPLRLGEVDPDEATSDLQQRQWLDYRQPTVEHTLSLVKAVNQAPPAPLPDPLPTPPIVPLSYQTQVADRVYSETPLTLDQQVGVLFGLRQLLQEGRDAAHVLGLATRFRAREDLLAAVVPDADDMLTRARAATADSTAPMVTSLVDTSPVPTVPIPTVPIPTVPIPTVPIPTVPVPTVPSPVRPPQDRRPPPRRTLAIIGATAIVVLTVIAVALANRGDGDEESVSTVASDDTSTSLTVGFTATTDPPDVATTVSVPPSRDVQVPGAAAWTDTGVDVEPGDVVFVSAVGEVVHNVSNGAAAGPDGDDDPGLQQFNVTDRADHAALIGEIDDTGPFFVGSSYEVTIEQGGRLYLRANDAGFDNNEGSFTATITVKPSEG